MAQVFSCQSCTFSKNNFFYRNNSGRLLLSMVVCIFQLTIPRKVFHWEFLQKSISDLKVSLLIFTSCLFCLNYIFGYNTFFSIPPSAVHYILCNRSFQGMLWHLALSLKLFENDLSGFCRMTFWLRKFIIAGIFLMLL